MDSQTVIDAVKPSKTVGAHDEFVTGRSAVMEALLAVSAEIAVSDVPILIVGEVGVGKRALATRVHSLSNRSQEEFSATHASEICHESYFETTDGYWLPGAGTLFVSEVGCLSAESQTKLHARMFQHPAGNGSRPPRLIVSTREDLENQVRLGRFRSDLYYRLSSVCLRVPPLRHRADDIPELIDFFLQKYSRQFGRTKPELTKGTWAVLLQYHWPGNIRQLENAARLLVAIEDERMAVSVLHSVMTEPTHDAANSQSQSLKEAARSASRLAEREVILSVLARTRWNRKRAAQELKISYKALLYKLRQIGLNDGPERIEEVGV